MVPVLFCWVVVAAGFAASVAPTRIPVSTMTFIHNIEATTVEVEAQIDAGAAPLYEF